MHFDILCEDRSGEEMLEILCDKMIISNNLEHSYIIHGFQGKGALGGRGVAQLLNALPQRLKAYNRTYSHDKDAYCIIIVCDLDDDDKSKFEDSIAQEITKNAPDIHVYLCLSVEEAEAWLMGDIPAIELAYKVSNKSKLKKYKNDSICGTWEYLAECLMGNRATSFKLSGFANIGKQKCEWAKDITPHMDIGNNKSPSFCYFRDTIRRFL